jgi:hypothetical protein
MVRMVLTAMHLLEATYFINDMQETMKQDINSFNSIIAHDIAADTADAYMYASYGNDWSRVISLLLDEGYTQDEVKTIVRSKHMRWASDSHSASLHGFKFYYIGLPVRYSGKELINEMLKAEK